MKRRFAGLAAMALLTVCGVTAQAPTQALAQTPAQASVSTPAKADPWAALRFLLGSWEAKTIGGMAQAQAAAAYSFRLELRDHVLARHSRSGACAAPEDFDCQHNDLLYIYPAANGQTLQAIYFDNSGHVVRYDVTTPKANTTVLLSDSTQPGPQYRLSYTLSDGTLNGLLEIKLPNQTDFTSLLEWSGKQE